MSEADAAFDALAAEFFPVWFRFHPEAAAAAGLSGYWGLPAPQGDDEVAALGSWLEALVVALEELDYQRLDPSRRIDLRLMFGAARLEHQGLLERDWRHRDPLHFLPSAGLYRLALGTGDEARERLLALLGGLPEYLRRALVQLRALPELVCPVTVEAAVQEVDQARCYLRALLASPWLRLPTGGRLAAIEPLVDAACTALTAYAEGLRGEIAARSLGPLGCGARQLGLLLRHRHFLELDAGCARAVLVSAVERTAAELAELRSRIDRPAEAASARVPVADRLATYRGEAEQLRQFLTEAGLVSLPDAPLRIRERFACPRPPRLGSDYLAGDEGGTLYLPAPADDPLVEVRARVRRSTWGGAHLLAFAGGPAARRIPRRLCGGNSLELAWGLYLDDRLTLAGYLSPEDRLYALGQRQGALRLGLLDLDVHLGAASPAEVAAVSREQLLGLVRRPGDALAAVLGWQALTGARTLAERTGGSGFDERGLHDRLVAEGRIPLPLVLEKALGADCWRSIAAPWSAGRDRQDHAGKVEIAGLRA